MAQLRIDARVQLIQVEGLGQVVVGAGRKEHDLVGGGDTRRDDDDGQLAVGLADGPHDLLPGNTGQHEVGDNHIGTLFA